MSLQYKTGNFAQITSGDPSRDNFYSKNAIVCQVSPGARLPVRANESDAGADLFCWLDAWATYHEFYVAPTAPGDSSKLVIPPGKQMLVDTGIAMKIPVGYAGFLDVRSSQRNKGITSWGTGIIDSDYRGNVKVVLYNGSSKDYVIENGDKVAQIVIQKVELPEFVDAWNDTARGMGGFGSTGK